MYSTGESDINLFDKIHSHAVLFSSNKEWETESILSDISDLDTNNINNNNTNHNTISNQIHYNNINQKQNESYNVDQTNLNGLCNQNHHIEYSGQMPQSKEFLIEDVEPTSSHFDNVPVDCNKGAKEAMDEVEGEKQTINLRMTLESPIVTIPPPRHSNLSSAPLTLSQTKLISDGDIQNSIDYINDYAWLDAVAELGIYPSMLIPLDGDHNNLR